MDVSFALEMSVTAKFLFEWHLKSWDIPPWNYFTGGRNKQKADPALKRKKGTRNVHKSMLGYEYIPDTMRLEMSLVADWGVKALFEAQFDTKELEKEWGLLKFGKKFVFFIGSVPVVIEPYVRLGVGIKPKPFEVESLQRFW